MKKEKQKDNAAFAYSLAGGVVAGNVGAQAAQVLNDKEEQTDEQAEEQAADQPATEEEIAPPSPSGGGNSDDEILFVKPEPWEEPVVVIDDWEDYPVVYGPDPSLVDEEEIEVVEPDIDDISNMYGPPTDDPIPCMYGPPPTDDIDIDGYLA